MADDRVSLQAELQGFREASLQLQSMARDLRAVGTSGEVAAVGMDSASKKSFLMQQAMFTTRRVIYAGTLAVGALATAAIHMGLTFNSTMENNTVALTHFLGGVQPARRELSYLYDLAAKTPFEFPQLVDAAKRFLAFGFSVSQANKYLSTIGDTAAGLGGGAESISRMVLVFGQIRAAGRLMGQDMLQLEQIGINVPEILAKQLGLAQHQIRNIGRAGISADVAIPAIMAALQAKYGGLSKAASKTFSGQISTLHDMAGQLFGAMTTPLYNSLRDRIIPQLNALTLDLTKAFQPGGGGFNTALASIDKFIGAGGRLNGSVHLILNVLTNLWRILSNDVIPAFRFVFGLVSSGAPVFQFLAAILGLVASQTWLLKPAFYAYALWLTISRGRMLAAILTKRILIALDKAEYVAVWLGVRAIQAYELWVLRSVYAQVLWNKALRSGVFLAKLYEFWVLRAELAQIALNVAMDLNPVLAIIAGLIALGAIIGVLLIKYKGFRQAFIDTFVWIWNWIKNNWQYALAAMLGGPFGVLVAYIVSHFDQIVGYVTGLGGRIAGAAVGMWDGIKYAFRTALNWIIDKWDALHFTIGGWNVGPVHVPGITVGMPHIPHLAAGGTTLTGGTVVVGERGREALTLPAGAEVRPLDPDMKKSWSDGRVLHVEIPIMLDRRQIGEASAEYTLDQLARR